MADRLPGQTDQSENGRYFADLARATFVFQIKLMRIYCR